MGGLPRRDLWLLPLIAMVTVLLLLAGAEVASRAVWPRQLVNACRLPDDPVLGVRYQPNCSTTMKTPEGPWYTSTYNACGYRSNAPCGPVPEGGRRIAVLGTSISEGYLVEYANTIAARVGAELTRMCAAPIQTQNLGSLGFFGDWLIPRMAEALRLRPRAILFLMTPFDLEEAGNAANTPKDGGVAPQAGVQQQVFDLLKQSRAVTMAQSFLFRDPAVYLPLYLRYGDKADFLRPPFTPRWRDRLAAFERIIGALSDQAHQAGVPVMLAFVPQEAQVALMAAGRVPPPGIVPTALQEALAAVAARHGVWFADTAQALRAQPRPERLFYQVDGHLSGSGQPIAAAYIAERFAAEADGPFADCHTTSSVSALP